MYFDEKQTFVLFNNSKVVFFWIFIIQRNKIMILKRYLTLPVPNFPADVKTNYTWMCDTYLLELKNPFKTNLSTYLLLNNRHDNKYKAIHLVRFSSLFVPLPHTTCDNIVHMLFLWINHPHKKYFDIYKEKNHLMIVIIRIISHYGRRNCIKLKGLTHNAHLGFIYRLYLLHFRN